MKNNKKTILLILLTITTLILLSTASATTDNTNTTTTTSSIKEKTTTTEPVVKEKIENKQPKTTDKTQDKKITKTNKTQENTKKDSITIDGITYEQIIENENVEIEVIEDTTYFNKCTFNNDIIEIYQNVYINNSTINSVVYFENEKAIINNSLITKNSDGLMGESSLTISNSLINGIVDVYGNKEVRNSTIDSTFYINPKTYIYDVILGKNGKFWGGGELIGEPLDPSIKIDVNNLEELTNTINTATNDIENEYTINLNEGIYTGTTQTWNEGDSTQKITINGNNQSINIDSQLNINSKNTIIIKNLNLNTTINNNNPDLTIQDSTLQKEINNYNTLTLNNTKTNNNINNHNNLKIIGILNSTINNEGTLIIDKNTIIGENYEIKGNGKIYTNATQTINGNQTITNKNFKLGITIPKTGNITITNCQINVKITNNGKLTLQNCSLSNNNIVDSLIENKGNTTLIDCVIENNTDNGVVINTTSDLVVMNSNISNNTCIIISVPKTESKTINVNITNNTFTNNRDSIYLDKIILGSTITNINKNTFTNSSIYSMFSQTNIEGNTFTDTTVTINNELMNAANKISSNTFYNTIVISPFLTAYNNTFNGGSLSGSEQLDVQQCPVNYLEVYENTFNNATLNIPCAIANVQGFELYATRRAMMNNSIHNNIFNGKTGQEDVITLTWPEWNENTHIFNNTYNHTSIKDSINYEISPKLYKNDNITFNYQINKPKNYDEDVLEKVTYDIYIDDVLYNTNTTDNKIQFTTSGEHTITIIPSISATSYTKVVEVFPTSDVIITPDNINKYVTNNGVLTRVNEDDRVIFQGDFINLGEIAIDTGDILIDGQDAHFTNTTFTLEASNIVIQNMNIDNTQQNYAIVNTKRNNHILNNNINLTNTEGPTCAIKNTGSNTQIKNNNIYVDGPALSIDHQTGGKSNTQAILIVGTNKNTIQNNTITVTTSQESEVYGTIEGITANSVTNTIITQNNIKASDAKFTYAITMLTSVTDNSITENNITIIGYRYADGIEVGNSAENILIEKNNINIYCHNTTPVDEEALGYGIIALNMAETGTSDEIYIYSNNITINSTVGYGIEIYKTTNTQIYNNSILVTGAYSMGIGYAHSPNSKVINNNITTIGDSTQGIGTVTEEIQPETVGIRIQQDSDNIEISNGYVWGYVGIGPNIIHTNDKGKQDYCVNVVNSTGTQIFFNNLTCSNGKADNAIKNTTPVLIDYPNYICTSYTLIEIIMPSEILVNTTIPIRIWIEDEYDNDIINPVTGKLESNTITLTIGEENITFFIKNNVYTYNYTPTTPGTIPVTATYDGSRYFNATTTTKTLTVNPKPESHTNTTTENLTVGDSTSLTATFYTDDDQQITSGKAIFKVNGKTLRDDEGNVIYAVIIDGVATLPDVNITQEWMKPDTTIQAVYVGDDNKAPITTKPTTINIVKPEATITLEAPTEATAGTTITLKATVTDGENNITSGRVAFKLNGKTLKDPKTGKALYANVENGVATITYTIPEKTKAKEYTLTVVFTDTNYDRVEAESKLNVVKA